MEIKYFCSWWGLDHLGLEPMLEKIKSAGFDGVEIGVPLLLLLLYDRSRQEKEAWGGWVRRQTQFDVVESIDHVINCCS